MAICHDCGNEYKRIGTHWASSCSYPDISDNQHDILTGMMMGDAWAESNSSGRARVRIECCNKEYLEYLSDTFESISGDVSLRRTAEEIVKSLGGNIDKTRDSYKLDFMYHPDLQRYADWYNSGEKVWPKDIKLTPVTLKHWYCGDGHYNNAGYNNHIQIAMSNERKNTEKVTKMFERVGFDTANYNIQGNICDLTFTVEESKKIFQYMGDPLPGFEHKWAEV